MAPPEKAAGDRLPASRPLALLFFFSGIFALVYEALWQRRFALVFGSAAPATAAVLAAYFTGLGLGSWVFGRYPIRHGLKFYALLEIGIAAGAWLVEAWLRLFEAMPGGQSMAAKTMLAFLALGLPTACMGGTLPALGAFVDQGRRRLGSTAGFLYVVNTAGAAIGVLLVPFILLPILGARATLAFCVIGNISLAAAAWRLSRDASADPAPPVGQAPVTAGRWAAPAVAFLSGFVCFVVQVSWNRAFAQVHEHSPNSFAIIAAVFILALAAGGQIARRALARNLRPETILRSGWIAAALLLGVSPWLLFHLTNGLSSSAAFNGWWLSAARLLALALIAVFPSAMCIGIALPVVMEQAGKLAPDRAGRILGALLGVNLAGAVLGSLAAGFVFPQWLGLWKTFFLMAMLLLVPLIKTKRSPNLARFILLGALFPALNWIHLPRARVAADRGEKLLELSEGPHGITAVVERGQSRRLKLNNSYVLGGTISTGDERMQTHLPLLLHPNPKRIAFLGLGTGITAGGALFHQVQEITILEIVPEVAAAARAHFADANLRILELPKTRLLVDDARNFLRRASEKFDVIMGDLVVPWRSGEAALFTQETFASGKRALAPGGLYCQWVPLYQLTEGEFQILLRTFATVFPEVHLWRGDFSPFEPSLALVGFADGAVYSDGMIKKRLAEMTSDPANPHLADSFAVWMHYVGKAPRLDGARVNTEDRPWIELLAPINHAAQNQRFSGRALQKWHSQVMTNSPGPNAGLLLGEYALAVSENNALRARETRAALQNAVPPALYSVLFPPQ